MKKSKFINLFRTLSEDDFLAFRKHLKRLHASSDIAITVFEYIRKCHAGFQDEKKLEIGYAYRKIFKEPLEANPKKRIKLLNALSDLHLCLKEFLLLNKSKDKSFESSVLWLKVLQEQELDAEFSRSAKNLQLELGKRPRRSPIDYEEGMMANYIYYNHLIHGNSSPDSTSLQQYANNLDLFYMLSRLKASCEMLNLNNLLSLDFDTSIPHLALAMIDNLQNPTEHPLLMIYRSIYQLIADHHDKSYIEAGALLNENAEKIDPSELHVIISYLHNHAASQIRQGKEEYWEKTHQLNILGLKYGVFVDNGIMSPTQFNNIINVASKVKAFDWATPFVKAQKHCLHPENREHTTQVANALISFEKGNFKTSLHTLEGIGFNNIHEAIRLKTLMVRCYYELHKDEDKIFNYCASFEVYLFRHRKSNKEPVEATLNFIRNTKLLLQRKTPKEKLLHKIENTSPVYFKGWLLEKAADYKAEFAVHKYNKRTAKQF